MTLPLSSSFINLVSSVFHSNGLGLSEMKLGFMDRKLWILYEHIEHEIQDSVTFRLELPERKDKKLTAKKARYSIKRSLEDLKLGRNQTQSSAEPVLNTQQHKHSMTRNSSPTIEPIGHSPSKVFRRISPKPRSEELPPPARHQTACLQISCRVDPARHKAPDIACGGLGVGGREFGIHDLSLRRRRRSLIIAGDSGEDELRMRAKKRMTEAADKVEKCAGKLMILMQNGGAVSLTEESLSEALQ